MVSTILIQYLPSYNQETTSKAMHALYLLLGPLITSLERRLQLLAVFFFVFSFIGLPFLTLYASCALLYSQYWWLLAVYVAWMVYDFRTPERGARAKRWFQDWVCWKYYVDYFPIRLVKTAELPADRNYLIGCHPHGILSFGTYASLCTTATGFETKFPGIKTFLATLNGQFWWPVRREQGLICGAVASSKRSLDYILGTGPGNAVGVVLGGAEELLDTNPDNFDLNLLSRRGFVKVALQHGAALVPMYNFGENQTYTQVFPNRRGSVTRRFQTTVRKLWGICPPLINGRGLFNRRIGLLPKRTPIKTVVGKPIFVEKCLDPTRAQVEEIHSVYCNALRKLFDDHKKDFGISEETHLTLY